MEAMVEERLQTWKAKNPVRTPTTIFFYRDGVGDSQFDKIESTEIPAIQKAWSKIFNNMPLKLNFVIVSKRHQQRLYPTKNCPREKMSKFGNNVKPGTCVDTSICHPFMFDFYLGAHAAIKGTSYPLQCPEFQLTTTTRDNATSPLLCSKERLEPHRRRNARPSKLFPTPKSVPSPGLTTPVDTRTKLSPSNLHAWRFLRSSRLRCGPCLRERQAAHRLRVRPANGAAQGRREIRIPRPMPAIRITNESVVESCGQTWTLALESRWDTELPVS